MANHASTVRLRKCPSCKETVGSDSVLCPRCGVSFRGASIRRALVWLIIMGVTAWAVCHFFKIDLGIF